MWLKAASLEKGRIANNTLSLSQVVNAMFADPRRHTQKNNGVQPVILLLSHPLSDSLPSHCQPHAKNG